MLRLLNRIAWAFAVAAGAIGCAVALMVVASIVGRATMAAPVPGDVELTQLGVALAISLCLPWCQVHGGNIMVDFFTQRLPRRSRDALDAIGSLLLALMAALLSWRTAVGALGVREAFEATMILDLPMWWIYGALAPGLALTALIALVQAGLLLAGRGIAELRAELRK